MASDGGSGGAQLDAQVERLALELADERQPAGWQVGDDDRERGKQRDAKWRELAEQPAPASRSG